jgi:hypothetical protein
VGRLRIIDINDPVEPKERAYFIPEAWATDSGAAHH